MVSDFSGLDPTLDASLAAFRAILATNDKNGDNRLNVNDPSENRRPPRQLRCPATTRTSDGRYHHFITTTSWPALITATNGNGYVSATEPRRTPPTTPIRPNSSPHR